jgi:hypothetical protein
LDVKPAWPIEPTTGTATANMMATARKRYFCSYQHSTIAPKVPPTCNIAPAEV